MPAPTVKRVLRENKRLCQAVNERDARIVCLETQARKNLRDAVLRETANLTLTPNSTEKGGTLQQRICRESVSTVSQPRRATMLEEAVRRADVLGPEQDMKSKIPMMGSKRTGRQRHGAPRHDKARSVSNSATSEKRLELEQPSRDLSLTTFNVTIDKMNQIMLNASASLVQMHLRSASSASTAPLQRQSIYSLSPATAKKKKRMLYVNCDSV